MKDHTKNYKQKNQKNCRRTNKLEKGIKDYQFYIGTNKQAAEFEIAAEFIINYIKRTFERGNDIAETLRTLTKQDTHEWMPKLKMSKAEDEETRRTENRQHELEYKALLDEAIKRKEKYHQNLYKAYAFLWEKCTRAMQNKITGRNNFEQKIFNNPINLLIAIKEHSLNYQESRYEMGIITDAINSFFGTKQKITKPYKTTQDASKQQKRLWNLI